MATFLREGAVTDQVHFPDGMVFRFSLRESKSVAQLTASLEDHTLIVWVPPAFAKKWTSTDQVGLETKLDLPGQTGKLHVLVEKDFPCLHRPQEDKSDTFTELAPEE